MPKNSKLKIALKEKLEKLEKLELPDLPPYGGDELLICDEKITKLELPNLRSVS